MYNWYQRQLCQMKTMALVARDHDHTNSSQKSVHESYPSITMCWLQKILDPFPFFNNIIKIQWPINYLLSLCTNSNNFDMGGETVIIISSSASNILLPLALLSVIDLGVSSWSLSSSLDLYLCALFFNRSRKITHRKIELLWLLQ